MANPLDPAPSGPRPVTVLKAVAGVLAAVCLVLLFRDGVRIVLSPMFPHDDEWQGLQLIGAARLLDHKPLYPDYDRFGGYDPYAPGLPMLYAAAMGLFGVSVAVPKALVFIACFLSAVGVCLSAYRLTRSALASLVGGGVFAAIYVQCHLWYFNVRPDMFAVAAGVWGTYLAWRTLEAPTRVTCGAAAGLLFTFAALCKPNYALLVAFHAAYLFLRFRGVSKRAALLPILPALLVAGGVLLYFNSGQEKLFATMRVMADHPLRPVVHVLGSMVTYLGPLAVPIAFAVVAAKMLARGRAPAKDRGFWPGVYAVTFATGLLPFAKTGGTRNAFLLFLALTSILTAVSFQSLLRAPFGRRAWVRPALLGVLAAFLGSFALRLYLAPSQRIRTPDLRPVLEFVSGEAGKRIYYPGRNYLTYLACGEYYADDMVTLNSFLGKHSAPRCVVEALQDRRFDYILGDFHTDELRRIRDRHYVRLLPGPLACCEVYVPRPGAPRQPTSHSRPHSARTN